LIRGLDRYLAQETGLPVRIAKEPLTCVAMGTGRAMEEAQFRSVLLTG